MPKTNLVLKKDDIWYNNNTKPSSVKRKHAIVIGLILILSRNGWQERLMRKMTWLIRRITIRKFPNQFLKLQLTELIG